MHKMAKSHVVAKVPSIVSNLLLFGILMAIFTITDAQVGVCYGTLGNNLPPPREVISLCNHTNIKRMRLYGPNNDAVEALSGANIELMLGVENERLQDIASNQASADDWVQKYVITHGNVNLKYIVVGNELNATGPLAPFVGPSMVKIQIAIYKAGLANKIKVSTTVCPIILQESSPPSRGSFRLDYGPFLDPIIGFLVRNQSPLFPSIHTLVTFITKRLIFNMRFLHIPRFWFKMATLAIKPCLMQFFMYYSTLEKAGGSSLKIVYSIGDWFALRWW